MENQQRPGNSDRWKILSIVLISAIATTLLIAVGMASFRGSDEEARVAAVNPAPAAPKPKPAPAQVARNDAPAAPAPRKPSSADVEHCNSVANESRRTTGDTVKDAVIGGAAGAGLGAAGGAIAKGGRGAGKGAGIGGLVGVAAGTLYGLNETNKNDARTADAYRDCMASRGF